jgi:beta-xylosidase
LAYSRDGLQWTSLHSDSSVLTPLVGKDKLMRDPCIIRGGDGKFHMVWTTGWTDRYIGYASSTDLVNWSPQTTIPVMEHEPTARNCWAPELTYDSKNNEYLVYWSTTIPGMFNNEGSEDNYNHRVYYTITRDFKSFTPSKILIDPGFNCIDATIVPDENGFRVFLKDETLKPAKKNVRTGTSKELKGPYKISEQVLTGNYWAEGPTTLKKDGRWIVYFDKYQVGKYGAIESSDGKEWKDISAQIALPQGIRHGTIIQITEQEFEKVLHAPVAVKK